MGNFVIVADSNCGMEKDLREKYGIVDYVTSKITFPDGVTHDTDLDWEIISADDYYKSMRDDKVLYKTGVNSIDNVASVLEKQLIKGNDVLSIVLSSRMSSTYNVFMQARKELLERYPNRKICIVDSLRFSIPIQMMNIKAAEMRDEGKSIEEVYNWLEENKNCFRQMGPMDDMSFLARTGRVSNFKAFFGTLVGIQALGDFDPTGISDILTKVKGKKAALAATMEYVKRTIVNPEDQLILIGHTLKAEDAEIYKKAVEEEFHPKEVRIARVDMSCGANIGPGMVAVYYFGRKATEGLAEEKKIMEEIVANLKK